jgi:hypothetical protein
MQKRGGRQPLARHLKRERIIHDLAEAEKHCVGCDKGLRLIAEETSERYEYIRASSTQWSRQFMVVLLNLGHRVTWCDMAVRA